MKGDAVRLAPGGSRADLCVAGFVCRLELFVLQLMPLQLHVFEHDGVFLALEAEGARGRDDVAALLRIARGRAGCEGGTVGDETEQWAVSRRGVENGERDL